MRRRVLIAALAGGTLLGRSSVQAQQSVRMARIGYVAQYSLATGSRVFLETFLQGLRQRGYVEGQNIIIESRDAHGDFERVADLASELVRRDVDLIVVGNTPMALAARRATTTVPIVVPVMGDPVGDGLVASLAQPGGNITGLTFLGPELTVKRLQLLKDILPGLTRVAVLWHPGAYSERTTSEMLTTAAAGARALNLQLRMTEVRGPAELDDAFSTMMADRSEALLVFPSAMLYGERRRIVDFALRERLSLMGIDRAFVELGGLISYGANIRELFRQAAALVDKILKGARPADLPVEQPTEFELVLNLRTAKMLGIVIPPSLLARADEVIE